MVASLGYAVQVLKTPLIMVLGREACGAVDATIKSLKDGTTLPGHLPSLVAALKPAVDAVQGQGGDTLGNAIRRNVMLNVDKVKSAAPILSAFAGDNKIRVVGGIYELRTGKVQSLTYMANACEYAQGAHSTRTARSAPLNHLAGTGLRL